MLASVLRLTETWWTNGLPLMNLSFRWVWLFYDAHYPHKVDAKAAVQVAYHTQLASTLAVKACHEILPDSKIGII